MKPDRRAAREQRRHFLKVRRADVQYGVQLARVSRAILDLIRGMSPDATNADLMRLADSLDLYSDVLHPWARKVAGKMLEDVARRDERAWADLGEQMGLHLRRAIEGTPLGSVMADLLVQQENEITSLPTFAAARVRELANEALITGRRSGEIAKDLVATMGMEAARARMVARTAVATAGTTLMQARASSVGSIGYIWRISDQDTRPDHKRLDGQFFKWSEPPIVDQRTGFRSHPGCNANCRCFPEVILPEEIL